ncbi:hypothetical protein BDM02DRAFT_1447804 [Thelephora ganbajun]|uniref:Uncharacterized protein n=1 Tax=Thelephora ganbajun TaxID=370292 RepID=A0ACB6ZLE9_THEGA|nr:hypothetical protein BDM02DRAFT_1447804 [Thelephora ganbajun]
MRYGGNRPNASNSSIRSIIHLLALQLAAITSGEPVEVTPLVPTGASVPHELRPPGSRPPVRFLRQCVAGSRYTLGNFFQNTVVNPRQSGSSNRPLPPVPFVVSSIGLSSSPTRTPDTSCYKPSADCWSYFKCPYQSIVLSDSARGRSFSPREPHPSFRVTTTGCHPAWPNKHPDKSQAFDCDTQAVTGHRPHWQHGGAFTAVDNRPEACGSQ